MEGETQTGHRIMRGTGRGFPLWPPRLGPEAMYHLMRAVLALAQDTVQRYGGTLLQVSGEGFLALFGAPVAQEDRARRAVLAAFELRQRLHAPDALREQPHSVRSAWDCTRGPWWSALWYTTRSYPALRLATHSM